MKSKKCGFCASIESDNNPLIAGDEIYICSNCVLSAHKILYGEEDPTKCILDYATEIINNAEVILVLAGAGMSADSNLPTYRDKEGFWNDYPPYREIKKDYVAMTSPHGFSSDPHFAWGFFAHQYKLYKNAVPHEGYTKLLDLLLSKKDYFVVTTNVDGLFIKSGFAKKYLHEAHGSIHKLQCSRPCHREAWEIESLNVEIDYSTMNALDPLPLCPTCGAVSRPNIFMFGDTDESYVWEESQESASKFREWRQKNLHKKVVILEIGVGAEGLKRHVKQYYQEFSDTTLIRINPEFDTSYRNENIFYLSMSAKEAFLTLTKSSH
ncbi:MAG: NAD-dependent protein deacetylase [Sulfurovum sp.]|nr:NAD-dependent protein deacetylase [Sulfurovum sp.]